MYSTAEGCTVLYLDFHFYAKKLSRSEIHDGKMKSSGCNMGYYGVQVRSDTFPGTSNK